MIARGGDGAWVVVECCCCFRGGVWGVDLFETAAIFSRRQVVVLSVVGLVGVVVADAAPTGGRSEA